MAKRRARSKRKDGSRNGARRAAAPKHQSPGAKTAGGPPPGQRATAYRERSAGPAADPGAGSAPRALLIAAGLVGLYGVALLVLTFGSREMDPLIAGLTLTHHPLLIFAAGGACVVATFGLARSLTWGWWLGAVLAQFNLWRAAWETISSDVAADAGAPQGDWVLASSVARLALWLGVSIVLHGYATARHFHLSWRREEERRRTHRVIYYGVGLLVALRLSSRFFGPGPTAS